MTKENQTLSALLSAAPEGVREKLAGQSGQMNTVGLSGSAVACFEQAVLKTGPADGMARREARILPWLEGRIPGPRLLHWEEKDGRGWLLMSRVPGEMAVRQLCSPRLFPLLAEGLKLLWQAGCDRCPSPFGLEERLLLAEERVKHGLCDLENVQPDTYGPGGFSGPEELLRWLKNHRPPVDRVLSHGDFCLPNLLLEGDRVSGFIDLGMCAPADRYQDLALCYRSLKNNGEGGYGGPGCPGLRPEGLFDALGISPDWEKVRYYILLDELF